MTWIVLGEEKGRYKLVSKSTSDTEMPGIIPKGSYLTVESEDRLSKYILRVDESEQFEPYRPSPLVVDMDLSGLYQDTKCQNVIYTFRVKDINNRKDGKIDFIHPQLIARRSTQEEIDIAMGNTEIGPRVFLATIHGGHNQLLLDEQLNFITTRLPDDMFFHQMLICGMTGSGKTVAMKYFMQYFTEELHGAVLAINVKDIDLLQMNQPSISKRESVINEWKSLGEEPHGIINYVIYYPANTQIPSNIGVDLNKTEQITLKVKEVDPESLIGLLQNVTEIGAQLLPDIFRYWKDKKEETNENYSFNNFVSYFESCAINPTIPVKNIRGDVSEIHLHKGTFGNIERNLTYASALFDNPNAKSLQAKDILFEGKLSVINVTGEKGVQFGSILLRDLLKKIVDVKRDQLFDTPILVIIDEVHQFYGNENMGEALGVLDTICRTGRSQKIGVIFASQNMEDLPSGLSNVINTKIMFRSDYSKISHFGISKEEFQTLSVGYAVVNVHNLPQLRIIKFPISLAGVIEK